MSDDKFTVLFWTMFLSNNIPNDNHDTDKLMNFLGELSFHREDLYDATENFNLVLNTWGIRFNGCSTDIKKPSHTIKTRREFILYKMRNDSVVFQSAKTIAQSLDDTTFSSFILGHNNNKPVIYNKESFKEDYYIFKTMKNVFHEV